MNKKVVYFVPVFLVIVSIITSFIAFSYSKKLENGFINVNEGTFEIEFEGEYFSIMGNLGDNSAFITVDSLNNYLLITIYDSNQIISREYTLIITEVDKSYSSDIINDYIGTTLIDIDNIEDYIFKLDLEKDIIYEAILEKTTNNIEDEEIDLILINIPEHLLNMKNLNEGISFTTLVFAFISGTTILIIYYVKKDD